MISSWASQCSEASKEARLVERKVDFILEADKECGRPTRLLYPWDFSGRNTRVAIRSTISFFRASPWPRDQTCVSCNGRQILYLWATGEALGEGGLLSKGWLHPSDKRPRAFIGRGRGLRAEIAQSALATVILNLSLVVWPVASWLF